MIRFAKIPLLIDIAAMQEEVKQLPAVWKAHMNAVHYTGDWNVLSLRSPGGLTDNIIPDITDDNTTYENTSLMEQCPAIRQFVSSLQCPVMSVRLMNLQGGAVIKPHRDFELCFEKGEARLHIPVFTNEQVSFFSEDTLIPMREGECWYINANIKHSVENKGTTDRIHLVIDCGVNEFITALFEQADKNEVEERLNVAHTIAMIESLKLLDTDTSLALAASLQTRLAEQEL